LHWCK